MPKLLGQAHATKLSLPSTKDEPNEGDRAWVEIRSRLSLGDIADIAELSTGPTSQNLLGLSKLITNWNYTEDGTPNTPKMEITLDNVRKMDPVDFDFLTDWLDQQVGKALEGLGVEEKKASTATSTGVAGPTPTLLPTTPSIPL
jgi:hypothetical protein